MFIKFIYSESVFNFILPYTEGALGIHVIPTYDINSQKYEIK